jgi:cytochrome c oxidase subunit IV
MTASSHVEDQVEHYAHSHPHDGHYIKIALVLALLTAAETLTYFIDVYEDNTAVLLLTLLPIMAVKFFMVAWFFMHLQGDSRIFSRLFLTGITLAVLVYMIMMLTFDEFF